MIQHEQNGQPTAPLNENIVFVAVLKVIIVSAFLYPLLHYSVFNKEQINNTNISNTHNYTETIETIIAEEEVLINPEIVIKQPSCPLSYLNEILKDLCLDLYIKHEQCTPEDINNLEKHKMPKIVARNSTPSGEPRGTIVGYVAAGLLLTSLGAAFVELYKAKSQSPVKTKAASMSRKCSLADLTVLKHNRKELVRRESILEMADSNPLKPQGRKVSRPPLRLD